MNNDYAIDLAQYYGIPTSGLGGVDVSTNYHPNLPSLEQIASYNLEQARAEAAKDRQHMPQSTQAMPNTMSQPITAPGTGTTSNTHMDNSMDTMKNMGQDESLQPIPEYNQPYPITAESIQYLNGFIRSQVGRNVSIEFLVGTNQIVTKEGFLVAVGANFILLNQKGTNDILACDFYNIKFITFYY